MARCTAELTVLDTSTRQVVCTGVYVVNISTSRTGLSLVFHFMWKQFVQAIGTAADLARIHKSKVTVLVVDQPGAEGDSGVKLQVINK